MRIKCMNCLFVYVYSSQINPPIMDIKTSSTASLDLSVHDAKNQDVLLINDSFILERSGLNGRTVLSKCGELNSFSNCLNSDIFIGSIYAFWMTEPTIRCDTSSFTSSPYIQNPRYCYYLTDSCQDNPLDWQDINGRDCSWYDSDPLIRCKSEENASEHCCSCNGGKVTDVTLVKCASENNNCTLPTSKLMSEGGVWVYWGVIESANRGVLGNFVCQPPYVTDPLPTGNAGSRFCYTHDSLNLGRWVNVSSATVDTNWKFSETLGVPGMFYQYRTRPNISSTYDTVSEPVTFYMAPAPSAPMVSSAGRTIKGRMTYTWTESFAFVKNVTYTLFLDGIEQITTSLTTWSMLGCEVGRYYDFSVTPAASANIIGHQSENFGRYCGEIPGTLSQPTLISTNCSSLTPRISISWDLPSFSGTFPFTGYRILRAVEPTFEYNLIDPVTGVPPHQLDFTDGDSSPLTQGLVYGYRVFATNGVDDTDYSFASPALIVICN